MYFLNSRAERALPVVVDEDMMGWTARSESESLPLAADNGLDAPAADWGRPRSLRNDGGHAVPPPDAVLRSIFAVIIGFCREVLERRKMKRERAPRPKLHDLDIIAGRATSRYFYRVNFS